MSCGSGGGCAAGGQYFDAKFGTHAFVLSGRNGSWGTAIGVPGLAALKPLASSVTSASCAPTGGCVAGGYYEDASSQYHAFVTSEKLGKWSKLTTLFSGDPGSTTFAEVASLACPSAGSCTAAGGRPASVVTETDGRWGKAVRFGSSGTFGSGSAKVSCATVGDCTAGWGKFVVSEQNRHWGKPVVVPGLTALAARSDISSVKCVSVNTCVVGGTYDSSKGIEVFVASERNGNWGKAIELPGFTALNEEGAGELASVSCISFGNCVAVGSYAAQADFQGGSFQAFVASEKNGTWGKAIEAPGIPTPSSAICEPDSDSCVSGQAESASCTSAGTCVAGGWFDTTTIDGQNAFVSSYKNGRWTKVIRIPGLETLDTANTSQVNVVSCIPDGLCAAGGFYSTAGPFSGPAFLVTAKNGTWGAAQTVHF